jgi:hypothetical protein
MEPGVPADRLLRSQLVDMLRGEGARMPFDDAVADFPTDAMNRVIPNGSVTPWHMLEHLRLTQWDILDYIRNRAYVEIAWPDDYWPPERARATPEQFQATIDAFRADNEALRRIVRDPTNDVFATIPDTPGHTIIREVRIVADHNSYHLGEFAILRQAMSTWPAGRQG